MKNDYASFAIGLFSLFPAAGALKRVRRNALSAFLYFCIHHVHRVVRTYQRRREAAEGNIW